jgi:DNA-binding NarL/FixJ family response regulator
MTLDRLSPTHRARVVVCVPSASLRDAIAGALRLAASVTVVAMEADAEHAVAAVRETTADVLIVASTAFGGRIVAGVRDLVAEVDNTRVVVFGFDRDPAYRRAVRSGGGTDYVPLDGEIDPLVTAVQRAAQASRTTRLSLLR